MGGKSSGLLAAVVLAVALATAATALDCSLPENDSQVFPNPANCSTYYICSRGNPVLMTCPPGLIWNSNVSACDFPFNWECKDQPPVVEQEEEEFKELDELIEEEDMSYDVEDDDYYGDSREETYEEIPPPVCAPDANYTSFPNPYNCSQFYECDNGVAHLTDCPPGLHFNVEFGVCDFVWSANCTELVNGTEVSFVDSSEEDEAVYVEPSCPPPGGGGEPPRFPNEDNCTTYWICDNGKATLQACPGGLVYNPAVQACDFPWALNCTGICCPNKQSPVVIKEEIKIDDASAFATPNCPPPGSGGEVPRFPNEDNCTTFWICDNGVAKLIACPIGLVYNPAIQNCDFAWALNCTGICCPNKKAPTKITEDVSVKFVDVSEFDVPSCPPPGGGGTPPKFPNPDNCTTYWVCDNGVAKLLSCPPPLVYNPAIENCDFDWALNCTGVCCPNREAPRSEEVSLKLDDVSEFDVPSCPPPGGGGTPPKFPNPDNCTTYWVCDNGVAKLLSCPPPLVYNPAIENCDFDWALNCTGVCCPNKEAPTKITQEVSLKLDDVSEFDVPSCPPPGGGGHPPKFPNADNCTTYWICDNGVAKLFSCPPGLVYNPAIENCDFDWALNCTGVCCPNRAAPRTDITCPKDPIDVVHIPNPDDCTSFYKCDVDEKPVLMKCPAGLEFNPVLLVCDYPENAQCSVHSYWRKPL